jgi:predicted DNA-binding WGR domain protein
MPFFTRIDPARNVARFWLSQVTPTLLGGWSLLREWGRIGSPGTAKSSSFESEAEARRAERQGIRKRERHGYQPTPDVVARWAEVMAAGGSIQASLKPKSRRRRKVELSGQSAFDFKNPDPSVEM